MKPRAFSKPSVCIFLAAILPACLLLWASGAAAAGCEDTFTNSSGGIWQFAGNWSTGLPEESESVCIPAGIPDVQIGPAVSAKVKTLIAESPLTIASTGSLTIQESSTAFSNELAGLDLEGTIHTAGSGLKLSGSNLVDGQITGGISGTAVTLVAGTLGGKGTIGPTFIARGGVVEPGGAGTVGTLNFGSSFSEVAGAQIDLDLESNGAFDEIQPGSSSNGFVYGAVVVHLLGPYVPTVGTSWEFISGTSGVLSEPTSVTPSQFSIHSVPGGDELRLDTALSGGGSGGGGGGSNTGTGSTGDPGGSIGSGSPTSTVKPPSTPAQCLVPKVTGLRLPQAKKALRKADCVPGEVTRRSSHKVKKGRVIATGNKAGKALAASTKIQLAVSTGP